VPLVRTRAERFDDLVLDAVDRLDRAWHEALAAIDFAVEDVPPEPPPDATDPVPLGRVEEIPGGRSRAVVYRRPIEVRTPDELDRAELVHDVVVELVADALGTEPERIDPDYDLGD
jgi:hypothetical protein